MGIWRYVVLCSRHAYRTKCFFQFGDVLAAETDWLKASTSRRMYRLIGHAQACSVRPGNPNACTNRLGMLRYARAQCVHNVLVGRNRSIHLVISSILHAAFFHYGGL